MKFLKITYFACLLFFNPSGVFARSLNIDVLGGLSSPTPGVAGELSACMSIYRLGCAGTSYLASYNEESHNHVVQNGQHLTAIFEHGFALGDDYHVLFIQGALGASYVTRTYDREQAPSQVDSSKWGGSFGGGFGVDLPIADLMSFRVAVLARHASVSGAATQIATLAGIRFGAEWLGFGK